MSEPFKLIIGSGQPMHDVAEEMAERVKEVIYDYAGRVPLALAVGVLDIVRVELIKEAE